MGCSSSKSEKKTLPVYDATEDGSEIIIHSEDKYDRRFVEFMKNEIKDQPEIFILNNLLLCFVFFKNYERDLYDFSNTAVPKEEQDLNSELVKEVKKCILQDTLLDKIKENITFHTVPGNNTNNEEEVKEDPRDESFTDRTVYIVNDNIEVKIKGDNNEYTSIDVPGCHVEIEDPDQDEDDGEGSRSRKNKGFLKLRVLGASSSEELPDKKKTIKVASSKSYSSSASENEEENETSDEYSTITQLKTPKYLNIVKCLQRRDTLPDICFEVRQVRKLNITAEALEDNIDLESDIEGDEIDDDTVSEDEDDNFELENEKKEDLFEEVTYLNSKGFMQYFQNEVFPNATGKTLGFSDDEIDAAKAVRGSIFCCQNTSDKIFRFRIVPALAIDWPSQAREYKGRSSRPTIIDKKDGTIYKWPTDAMVQEIMDLNCVVVPEGFVMKKGQNEDSDIEWEIHFPKAVRYLEMRMTHPQVRCYIFLLILYKTFIEKFTTHHGLLIEHIRMHMFWQCEKNARNWPENRMGTKVLQVINDLNSGLSINKIPHYFIEGKNIFENIPSKYLQFAQKSFHDITQFPVMHFLKALKNLKYIQSDFYPAPDLDLLYRILKKKNVPVPSRIKIKRKESKKNKRKSVVQVGSQARKRKREIENERWKRKMEKLNRQKQIEMQKQKEEEEAARTKESTVQEDDLKSSFQDLDMVTRISVIDYFIKHFMNMAKRSRQIGPKSQALLYLKQAWYNNKVVEEISGVCEATRRIESAIHKERELLENDSANEEEIAPPTPRRNNDQNAFIFIKKEPVKFGLKSSHSLKLDSSKEDVVKTRAKLFKQKRQRSVGFDDYVEKISFN